MLALFNRLDRVNQLITRKATGTPRELAEKLQIAESTLYETIALMKHLGAPIRYCKTRQSYYYTEHGEFYVKFIKKNPAPVKSEF
jgi:predicted DNA-binding transcriptional regulator YafY